MNTSERCRCGVSLAGLLLCSLWSAGAAQTIGFDGASGAATSMLQAAREGAASNPTSLQAVDVAGPAPSFFRGLDGRLCQAGLPYHGGPCDLTGGWTPTPGVPDPQGVGYYNPYSLLGNCPDFDHSNFMAAKQFAYSSQGLNYNDSDATQWALTYTNTHACNTLGEYQARYQALYIYAYSSQYMNLSDAGARAFALQNVERTPSAAISAWMTAYPAAYQFFYSSNYMNLNSTNAAAQADLWVRRGNCGDVASIEPQFSQQYDFAYGSAGLNLNSSQAISYAAQKVSALTPCGDLLLSVR